jgi:serine/threonine protein kinase
MKAEKGKYKIGDVIGYDKHKICALLGEGYSGIVYLTYSQRHKQLFALKMLKEEHYGDIKKEEWFRREANIVTALGQHPYITHVYWVDEIDGQFCLVMEYLPKSESGLLSLDDYLQKSPPDIEQTLRWAIQFCYGMEFANLKKVWCQRDIRPKNILICPQGDIKIADFGLASSPGATKRETESKMTVPQIRKKPRPKINNDVDAYNGHMPPEYFSDYSVCNQRVDIYSFGITLYRMLNNGTLPFSNSVEFEAFLFLNDCKLPNIESPLFPIITRCAKCNPDERYQSFKELRVDLESLLKSIAGNIVPAPQLREIYSWEWNNRGWSRIHLNHYNDALCDFNKALESKPFSESGEITYAIFAKAWCGKGLCYSELASRAAYSGDKQHATRYITKANQAFDNATMFDFEYCQAWYNWGNLFHHFRNFEPAIECYDWATQINPNYSLAWFNKAEAEFDLDRKPDATKSFKKFLELADPTKDQFQKDIAQKRLSELFKNYT